MIEKIKSQFVFDKDFLKGGMVVFIGSMGINIINYIFHLFLGRTLGPDGYGIIVSLISMLALLSIPISAIITAVAKFTSEANVRKKMGEIHQVVKTGSRYLLITGIIIVILMVIFSPLIASYLKIDSLYIKISSLFIVFALLVSINRGIMQGLKKFSAYSINILIEPLTKIIFFIFFLLLGIKIWGAVWAIIISIAIAYLFSFWPIKKVLKKQPTPIDTQWIWQYFSYTFWVMALLSTLTFIDVLMVKHYFSPEQAGFYAALSTIGKIILYVSMPVITVMFPMISEAHIQGKRHFYLLFQTGLVITVLSAIVLGVYHFIPNLVVSILFGQKFISIAPYITLFGLVFLILTLVNIFVYYFLSIRKLNFIWFVILAVMLELVLITIFHNSIQEVIYDLMISFAFLLISLMTLYLLMIKDKLRIHEFYKSY